MATHRVFFGKGAQTLTTIPHRAGSPVHVASATFEISDARHSASDPASVVVAAGTAATVDATSTTLSAKAGRESPDHRALTLVSTAGATSGHAYMLTSPSGVVELVTVAEVVSATALRTVADIRGAFPSGSTFKGIEVSATFPAPPAADDDNLDGLPWVIAWTLPGFPPLREVIHLERGEEAQLATLADLNLLDPHIPQAGAMDTTAALAQAHEDLRLDLQLAGVSECDLFTGKIGKSAVTYRAAHLVFSHVDTPVGERKAASYGARYQQLVNGLIVGAKKPDVVALDKRDVTAQISNPAVLVYGFGFQPGGQ